MSHGRLLMAVAALACVCSTGCGVTGQVVKHSVVDKFHYERYSNDLFTRLRHRRLARAAARNFTQCNPQVEYSKDFLNGLKQGFLDHLETGVLEPPVLPPAQYWTVRYESPEGHIAIEHWFAGYRHGIIEAEISGQHEWVQVPSSVRTASMTAEQPEFELPGLRAPEPLDETAVTPWLLGDPQGQGRFAY